MNHIKGHTYGERKPILMINLINVQKTDFYKSIFFFINDVYVIYM